MARPIRPSDRMNGVATAKYSPVRRFGRILELWREWRALKSYFKRMPFEIVSWNAEIAIVCFEEVAVLKLMPGLSKFKITLMSNKM